MTSSNDSPAEPRREPAPGEARSEREGRSEHEGLGVLVVDDDELLLRTLADILRRKGYDTWTAPSAAAGLALVASGAAPSPAIALVDLSLPDMSGIELIHRLRALSELTEVVILTGNASLDSALAALREESFDYLVKPVPAEQLLSTLRRAGERWRRRRAEESLRRSEERFRSLVENISDVLIVVDREGTVRYANGRVEAALGVTAAEAEGTPVLARVHADDLDVAKRLLQPPTVEPVEVRLRRRDGAWRVFACRSAELPAERGAPGVVILAQDVTDRRRLEAQARQAQKLDSIGRLAGGVAHDFNNLLTIVLGYTDLGLSSAGLSEDLRSLLLEVHAAGERGVALTKQLLAFARRQPAEARLVDPNIVVRGLKALLRRSLREDVALELRLDREAGMMRIDPGQLEQVVMNLAFNGHEAMPGGGRLTIATRRSAAEAATGAAEVVLAVTDTGIGMDEETRSRVFDPFFSTKPQGTGLGLATVYGIVQQAGGQITIDSAPGMGTTVEVHLPLAGETAAATEPTSPSSPQAGAETILVVDDEPVVRDVVRRLLEAQGYRCVAADAAEAVRLVEEGEVSPTMLLSDVMMPGMGGEEAATRIRAVFPRLPVVFMTGYSGSPVPAGGSAVLAKPVSSQTLAAAIRAALERQAR